MDKATRTEAKGRTLRLNAQDQSNDHLDQIELRLTRLFSKKHVVRNGKRIRLNKRMKVVIGNRIIDKYNQSLDVDQDFINMGRLVLNGK